MASIAGILTTNQKLFVQKVSPIIINESSDHSNSINIDSDEDNAT